MPIRVQTFSQRNLGKGACAAALASDGIIIFDISREEAGKFMTEFQAHIEALEMSWRYVFDIHPQYGYVWAYYDPEKFDEETVRSSVRASYHPI